MLTNVERSLSYREEDELQNQCSRVAQWIPTATSDAYLEVPVGTTDYCLKYFLHKEIRTRFKDVWTFQQQDKVLIFFIYIFILFKFYHSPEPF